MQYFATDSCEYDGECRYKPIKLKENEQICFKCGLVVTSVKNLREHIREIHGSEQCKLYAQNKCARGSSCWFSHSKHNNQYNMNHQDFHETPTMRMYSSVVGAGTGQTNQTQMREQVINMSQMMSQMVNQLSTVMSQMGITTQ